MLCQILGVFHRREEQPGMIVMVEVHNRARAHVIGFANGSFIEIKTGANWVGCEN